MNGRVTKSKRGPRGAGGRGEESRDRIVAAALELFARPGGDATTIREIARASGLNSQLIYYYFGDRRGLYRALIERTADRVYAALADASDGPAAPLERLEAFVERWGRIAFADADAVRLLHRAVLAGDPETTASVQRAIARNVTAIVALIEEAQHAGKVRPDVDARLAARSLAALIHYPVLFGATRAGESEPADAATTDRIASHTARLFVAGISTTGG